MWVPDIYFSTGSNIIVSICQKDCGLVQEENQFLVLDISIIIGADTEMITIVYSIRITTKKWF